MKGVTESSDITPASAPRAELRRKAHWSWLALSCSLLLTFLAWDLASHSPADRMRAQFLQRSEQIALAITRRTQEHEALLRGGVALFVASHDVNNSFKYAFHDARAGQLEVLLRRRGDSLVLCIEDDAGPR